MQEKGGANSSWVQRYAEKYSHNDDKSSEKASYLCKKAEIIYLPMQKGDVNLTYANISKAKRLLNYIPTVKFEEGLERFVKNFLESWK